LPQRHREHRGFLFSCHGGTEITEGKSRKYKQRTCERRHKTLLNEFHLVTFRKTLYTGLDPLQGLDDCNQRRPHQGRWYFWQDAHLDISGHAGVASVADCQTES